MVRKSWWGVVLGVAGAWGCATTPKWAAATTMAEEKFPPKAELQQLSLRPSRLDPAHQAAAAVEEWTLEGPLASSLEARPVPATSPWERAVIDAQPSLAQALTEDHRCIAREVARFVLAKNTYPGHSLRAFISRRCGTTANHVGLRSLTGEVPASVSEAKWLEHWKPQLAEMAKALGAVDLAGAAVARDGTRAVLIIAGSQAGAVLARPVPLVGPGLTKVEVHGRLARGGAERIEARINQGDLESTGCKTLGAASPPEFAFECEVREGDARTTVEVVAFDPGRILGRGVVALSLWPSGPGASTWRRPARSAAVAQGEFGARFIAAVNAMRTRAGLGMLTEAKAQSATAVGLAPHYFAASLEGGDKLDADRVALGMLAGWDVEGDIVSSGFGNEWLSGTRDLDTFLEFCLDSPFQRKSLTDARATQIAVGPLEFDASSTLAAIFATYVPLGTFDRKESEIAIITRLNQLRLDRGLPLAQWTLWPQDEGALIERHLKSRRYGPDDAGRHALEATAAVSKDSVQGYVQLVDDLEHFQFPPEVLLRPDINVFLAVGTYRGESWAQSRYVVCFVLARKGDIETAAR